MPTVRALESFARNHPVAYTVVGPSFWGDGMYPPTDAVYFPLYTKCCELDLPLCMNTGHPRTAVARGSRRTRSTSTGSVTASPS